MIICDRDNGYLSGEPESSGLPEHHVAFGGSVYRKATDQTCDFTTGPICIAEHACGPCDICMDDLGHRLMWEEVPDPRQSNN